VPNKEFITGRLLNWTLSDAKVRTVIPVGIAYGSDVELAIKTLLTSPKMVPCLKHK
jgi:potassium efflux system protein